MPREMNPDVLYSGPGGVAGRGIVTADADRVSQRAVDRMRDERTALSSGASVRGARLLVSTLAVMLAFATTAVVSAEDPAVSGFRPEEISIGEPLALPFGGQNTSSSAASPPAATPRSGAPASEIGLPGSGWLGLSLAESSVPGRWQIDEVAPGGPAARAGIQPRDELRAINGVPLAGAEEVSAVMTAIASGQTVRVAIARNDDMQELVLEADPRPSVAATRTQPPPLDATPPAFEGTPAAATVAAAPSPLPEPVTAVPPAASTNPWGMAPQPATAPIATPAAPPTDVPAVADMPAPSRFGSTEPVYATPPAASPAAGREGWGETRQDDRRDDRRFEPPPAASAVSTATGGRIALGVRTLPIDPATQSRFNLSEPAGAYVFGVVEDLPASRAGVPPGSVIVALDGRPVRSPGELTQLVSAGPLDRPVTLQFVLPGGESRRASVELQSLTAPVVEALAGPQVTTAIPTLEPGPRRAERPVTDARATDAEATAIREELRLLRQRLERLERRLQSVEPTLRR
jgi:membrane-associated protease RseP (regulator of RpoE activity)